MANTTYTVELNEAQQKAMEYVAYDPAEWILNVVHNRARMAIDEIYKAEVERMTNDPNVTAIPADKNAVVLAAEIKTAKELSDSASTNPE
jgi:hypothetical protein